MKKFKCISCRTDIDGNDCKFAPKFMNQCSSPFNHCYTYLQGGFTLRGCVGDNIISDAISCDQTHNCDICSNESLCNNHKIELEMCSSYNGNSTDNSLQKSSTKICPLGVKKLGCYHREDPINGKLRKGCVNELSKYEQNQKNDKHFKICFGDKCNSREKILSCVTCDSNDVPECISPGVNATSKICDDYLDACFTYTQNNIIRRGCLKETNSEVIEKIQNNLTKYQKCFTELCNNETLTDTCIKCDSESNPNCFDDPSLIEEFICSTRKSGTKGCYLRIFDGRLTRGCVNDLPIGQRFDCEERVNGCQICHQRNCNKKKNFHQKCFKCDGLTDENCNHGGSNETITCSDYPSKCFVGIDEHGYIQRGCSSSKSETMAAHELCLDDYCNNQIFPKLRRSCYQCNGTDDCYFYDSNPTIEATLCQVYMVDDGCWTFVNGSFVI